MRRVIYINLFAFVSSMLFSWQGANNGAFAQVIDDYMLVPCTTNAEVVNDVPKFEQNGTEKNYTVWKVPGGENGPCEIWCRGGFGDDLWQGGVESPTGDTAFMMSRENLIINDELAEWGGWMTTMFDFDPANPLPADEMEAIKQGDRVFAMDVYFEESGDSPTFQEMADWTDGNMKMPGGIKFQVRLGNQEAFAEGGTEWFIAKEAYLEQPGKWQTLYFARDDLAETGLDYTTPASEVDRFMFVPAYAYPFGDNNNIYMKNVRLTTTPPDTVAPGFVGESPKILNAGAAFLDFSFELDEAGTFYYTVSGEGNAMPSKDNMITYDSVQVSSAWDSNVIRHQGLNPATAYKFYFMNRDKAGNTSAIESISFTTGSVDIQPPSFAEGTPEVLNITASKARLSVAIDEPGVVYFLVQDSAMAVPVVSDVLQARKENIYQPDKEIVWDITGLQAEKKYGLFILAADAESPANVQDTFQAIYFNTSGLHFLPDWELDNPMVIDNGGVYENLVINSRDYNKPAVNITTDEPVVIQHCVISGSGDLVVNTKAHAKLEFYHNYFWGTNPDIVDLQQGRSVKISDVDYFTFKNNYTNQTGGLRVQGFAGSGDKSVLVEGNIHEDLTTLVSNGTGKEGRAGYDISKDNGGQWNRQMVILKNVNVPSGTPAPRIQYNLMENNEYEPDNVSATEDLINNFGSIGPDTTNPIIIAKNFLRGAHGPEPFNPYRVFTGTCIVMDASAASGADFGNVEVHGNFLSYCQNSGIGISSGHHVRVFDNTIINPLKGEDGKQISGFYGNAAYLWAWKDDRPVSYSEFFNNRVHNFKSKEQPVGSDIGRNDLWLPDCNGTNDCHDNYKFPVTLNHDAVLNMYCEFYQVLKEDNVSIGPNWGPGLDLIDYDFENCVVKEYGPSDPGNNEPDDSTVTAMDASGKAFRVYPNPAGDYLRVILPREGETNISILNLEGKTLIHQSFSGEIVLDVSHLKAGMYIIRANLNGKQEQEKLFIR